MIGCTTITPPDGLTVGRDFEIEPKDEHFSDSKS